MKFRFLVLVVLAIAITAGCSKTTSPSAAPSESQAAEASRSPVMRETPEQPLPKPISTWSVGKSYYGVYVAVEPTQNAAIDKAMKRMEALGLRKFEGAGFSNGSLGCDYGAAAQLGAPEDSMYVAVYFETGSEAKTFAASLDPPPVGIARVEFGCAD